jgi:maltose-binding protein MalE
MNFRKRLGAVAIILTLLAALIYGSTLPMEKAEDEDVFWFANKETIYFWYADETMTHFVNSAAVEFGNQNNVRVIPVLTSDNQYLEEINDATLRSDYTPDVYYISHDSLEKAYMTGLAGEILDPAGICTDKNFPAAALSAVTFEGKKIAYPLNYETSVLLYNKNYLDLWAEQAAKLEFFDPEDGIEKPVDIPENAQFDEELLAEKVEAYKPLSVPKNVDGILAVADTFDAPEGVDGVLKWDVSDIFYNYWIVGEYMKVGGEAGDDVKQVDIANEAAIQCLEVYKDLNRFFSIESDTVHYESVLQDFIDGKLVYSIVTTNAVNTLRQAQENGELAFEYGFAPMPDVSGDLKSRSMSSTGVIAVNGYSKHRELANSFAQYLVTTAARTLHAETGKVAANLHVDAQDEALSVFMQEYAESIPLPKMIEVGNFWLQLERLFANVWNGADVPTVVGELSDQIHSQITNYANTVNTMNSN